MPFCAFLRYCSRNAPRLAAISFRRFGEMPCKEHGKGRHLWVTAPPKTGSNEKRVKLSSLDDFAALDAGRADLDTFRSATDYCANFFQIQIPTTVRHVVGVADLVPKLGAT